METAYLMITRHCRNTLCERQWPTTLEVAANLSYSQGDGVAFYGRLDKKDLLRLLPALRKRGHLSEIAMIELAEEIRESDMSVTLYPNSLGRRYSHAGTIEMTYEDIPASFLERHCHWLLCALRDDIRDVCSAVASDGYKLIEAIEPSSHPTAFERNTPNFTVQAIETENITGSVEYWDDEVLDQCLASILNDGATFRTLEIRITCRHSGSVLGRAWLPDTLRKPNQPVRKWFNRECLNDAAFEAREQITTLLKTFTSFKGVAK
ncbi:NgrC [Pectobacterium brasiliense]|uniref:NgrC n=1 Tax=Pectobacterium brasiliense TaxID=180957 RepID=UPI0019695751|nr:NgrC [Pectobacterium brasiliense]MBN3263004.1 NgrC [Pectobacterium brasiliense]